MILRTHTVKLYLWFIWFWHKYWWDTPFTPIRCGFKRQGQSWDDALIWRFLVCSVNPLSTVACRLYYFRSRSRSSSIMHIVIFIVVAIMINVTCCTKTQGINNYRNECCCCSWWWWWCCFCFGFCFLLLFLILLTMMLLLLYNNGRLVFVQ